MKYSDFVKLAKTQDNRNHFEEYAGDLSFLPESLRAFYTTNNPTSVEVILQDSTSIRFSPVKYLKQLQVEYGLDNPSFVFATHEGDPIYLRDDGIFSCVHGANDVKENKICNTFDSYIELLSKEMKKL